MHNYFLILSFILNFSYIYIRTHGTLKEVKTKEELAEARREYSKKYYWKNKEKVDERVRRNNKAKRDSKA